MEEIKYTLKSARVYREKSRKEMAELLNIHEQTYTKLENNPELVTIGQAKKISKFLNIKIDSIFFAN